MPPLLWVLVVILLVFALLGVPSFGFFHASYGWTPSALLTILVIIIVVIAISRRPL